MEHGLLRPTLEEMLAVQETEIAGKSRTLYLEDEMLHFSKILYQATSGHQHSSVAKAKLSMSYRHEGFALTVRIYNVGMKLTLQV